MAPDPRPNPDRPYGIIPARLPSRMIRLNWALMNLIFSTCALDRRPCFVCAAMTRALPSGVRGPVDLPPCSLQRFRSLMAGFWQGVPARVLAPHLRPCQPGPKRVAMPALVRAVSFVLFTDHALRSWGRTYINYCGPRLSP